jgi:hypothetical protein
MKQSWGQVTEKKRHMSTKMLDLLKEKQTSGEASSMLWLDLR